MALQTQFGLTFSEAIHLLPGVHIRDADLWITRDIAFNSNDRIVPVRSETQKAILAELVNFTDNNKSLIQFRSYEIIRMEWRSTLTKYRLPSNKSWRYLYARQMHQTLLPVFGNYKTCWLIRDEMGIKSRNTLWSYLNARN